MRAQLTRPKFCLARLPGDVQTLLMLGVGVALPQVTFEPYLRSACEGCRAMSSGGQSNFIDIQNGVALGVCLLPNEHSRCHTSVITRAWSDTLYCPRYYVHKYSSTVQNVKSQLQRNQQNCRKK